MFTDSGFPEHSFDDTVTVSLSPACTEIVVTLDGGARAIVVIPLPAELSPACFAARESRVGGVVGAFLSHALISAMIVAATTAFRSTTRTYPLRLTKLAMHPP